MPIFKRFQQCWERIDKQKYETGLDDDLISQALEEEKKEILSFVLAKLEVLSIDMIITTVFFIHSSFL